VEVLQRLIEQIVDRLLSQHQREPRALPLPAREAGERTPGECGKFQTLELRAGDRFIFGRRGEACAAVGVASETDVFQYAAPKLERLLLKQESDRSGAL